MSTELLPLVFEPLLVPKPWGGRRLAGLLNKFLAGEQPIGESWEIASLPGAESRVRGGPFDGYSLEELVTRRTRALVGGVPLVDGRFPLLIKFLDARENLSVQVHPLPAPDDPLGLRPGIKHEAWYVVQAEPGAELFIGLKPGVTPADLRSAASTSRMAELLRRWPARAGQCYYLPSGIPHALGAGVLVAEVQTPSDITYRLYDWDRRGLDGLPRELHIDDALRSIRADVSPWEILQADAVLNVAVRRGVTCQRFVFDERVFAAQPAAEFYVGRMHIWMVLEGSAIFSAATGDCPIRRGDTALIPAAMGAVNLRIDAPLRVLDITIPAVDGA